MGVQDLAARAYWMAATADGGYSQPNRLDVRRTRGVWTPGFTFEADCSSLAIEAANQAGYDTGGATYTGDMRACMASAGWSVIPYAATGGNADNRDTGDVLLSVAASGGVGHTGVFVGDERIAEAWIDGRGDIMGSAGGDGPGDDTGGETRVIGFYAHPYTARGLWTHVLRPPATTSDTSADSGATPGADTTTPKGNARMFGITYTANAYGGITAYVLLTESAGADALDRVQAQVYNSILPNGFTEVPEHHAEMLIREAWERHNRIANAVAATTRVDINEATARVLNAVKEGADK